MNMKNAPERITARQVAEWIEQNCTYEDNEGNCCIDITDAAFEIQKFAPSPAPRCKQPILAITPNKTKENKP